MMGRGNGGAALGRLAGGASAGKSCGPTVDPTRVELQHASANRRASITLAC